MTCTSGAPAAPSSRRAPMARQPITRSQPMPRRKAPSFKSGAIVRCESSQEEEAVARFEACPSVTKITAQPVPMTYMHEGKQYIVVAVSGQGSAAELIGLALPDAPK